MKTIHFVYQSILQESVNKVYDWHLNPMAFQMLTPPWEKVRIAQPLKAMKPGNTVKLIMYPPPGLIPISWQAQIVEVVPSKLFVDEQIKGPFSYWRHEHRFASRGDKTCIVEDSITFALPMAFVSHRLMGDWVLKQLTKAFTYRHQVYAQMFRDLT